MMFSTIRVPKLQTCGDAFQHHLRAISRSFHPPFKAPGDLARKCQNLVRVLHGDVHCEKGRQEPNESARYSLRPATVGDCPRGLTAISCYKTCSCHLQVIKSVYEKLMYVCMMRCSPFARRTSCCRTVRKLIVFFTVMVISI